jgi:hypothetical protein
MQDVPITFEFNNEIYTGHFSNCTGAGNATYDSWHLMIDKFYYGALHYSGHAGRWLFDSPSNKFKELESWFEAYMVGWFW